MAYAHTLRHRARPAADLVLVDECHRALAASYRAIAADYPNAVHLGLTATPYRADGKGLGDAYDELVVVASPRQLIAEGFLVEPRVFTVPAALRPDLSRLKVARGDDWLRRLRQRHANLECGDPRGAPALS
ncbi:MAG: DEAD/DEAH box helicase family protein [Polyangiaceae bacterium]|nr:DEAD/DEAH box helicase family protein [Polyangiaceae bacterium]